VSAVRAALVAPAPAPASRWIVSAAQDLVWFHGSVLAGIALLVFFALVPLAPAGASTQPAVLVLLLWGIFFDGTHVAGTYARSYLAPGARAGLPGWPSLGLVALGPAVALVDRLAFPAVAAGRLFPWFLLGALLWAYWHLVRQHWGFVALYRRRGADVVPACLDEALLWLGCLYPFVRYSLGPAYAASGLPVLLPAAAMGGARLVVDVAFAAVGTAVLTLWIARGGLHRPGPKQLLMAIVIAFHAAVFALLGDLLAITATLTIFHNLQYHRIVWQHEAAQGRRPLGGLGPYLLAGLGLGVAWYGARVLGAHVAGPGWARNTLLGLGWGVAFHHYLVDGRIWRTRRSS
jgi:hypothetical protein